MQQQRIQRGKRQVDVSPSEIQAECLAIRSVWSWDERVKALTDVTVARLQPDWNPAWDAELQRQEDLSKE